MGKPSGVTEPGGGLLSLGVMCSGLPWFHRAGLAGGRQGQFWAEIRDRSADESVAGTHLESELWRPVSSLQTGQSPTHASPWGPQLGLADWGGGAGECSPGRTADGTSAGSGSGRGRLAGVPSAILLKTTVGRTCWKISLFLETSGLCLFESPGHFLPVGISCTLGGVGGSV